MTTAQQVFDDSRVIDAADVDYGTDEKTVFSVDAPDARTGIEILFDLNRQGLQLDQSLVRLYAITLGLRAEVARGRVDDSGGENMPKQVLRWRGVAEKLEVTIQRDPAKGSNVALTKRPRIAIAMAGTNSPADFEPRTCFRRPTGFPPHGVVSKLPTALYSATAVTTTTATDLWLMIFSLLNDPVNTAIPSIPPLYLPGGGKGNQSYDFQRRPYFLGNGLAWALSTTPDQLTIPAANEGGCPVLFEFN